jgi:hypothetical protein
VETNDLLKDILKKLITKRWALLIGAICFAILGFFIAKNSRASYTAKATLFPLTTPSDNSLTNATLSGILGLGDAPKSFSNEATINIVELALSRNVRETVAGAKLPLFNNATIAELLLNDINDHKSFFSKNNPLPKDSLQRIIAGGELLKASIVAKLSKNGVLELFFTHANQDLVSPISFTLIEKISQFYIDLKRQKAIADYNFTLGKIDSFQTMLNNVDKQSINFQRTTLFTPNELLEYNLPKENLVYEKSRIQRYRDMSINNRDEAVWRLQKATPIIATLDKPLPPFDKKASSPIAFAIAGLFLGFIFTGLFLISGLLSRYVKAEITKSIFQ